MINLYYHTSYNMSEAGPSTQTTPVVAEAGQGKKRKRTGKEREERKQAAILAVSIFIC
jgi:hypothetical protein